MAVLPHSRALLSIAEIFLALIWLLEEDFNRKYKQLKENKSILILSSIFLLHIVGLIYTTDFSNALKDIKIKLPLLLFPIIVGTSNKLKLKDIKLIISVFTISIVLKTFFGIAVLSNITGKEINNIQDIAGKFSHIRYALLLNIAIFSNIYLIFISPKTKNKNFKVLHFFAIIWLSIFLFILHSVTGWIIFFILIIFTGIYIVFNSTNTSFKSGGIMLSFTITGIIIFYLIYSINKFNRTDKIDINNIDTHTLSSNPYINNFESKDRENGHFVYVYLCEKEIKKEWNNLSNIKYKGKDKKDQNIRYTLIRYLSSKKYRKDKEGINKLSKKDIQNIEAGMTNYIFEKEYAIYPKIYEILWQIEKYRSGKNPQSHSITQRIEYLKIGIEIIRKNFWIGVGTGDYKIAYKQQYEKSDTLLSKKYQLRAHNQFITVFVTFGLIGFIWFIFAYTYPIIKEKKYKDYMFICTFIILTLSMLNEDTLETQMGATIFAFFISFYLFADPKKTKQE